MRAKKWWEPRRKKPRKEGFNEAPWKLRPDYRKRRLRPDPAGGAPAGSAAI